jgi:hypothetical protein
MTWKDQVIYVLSICGCGLIVLILLLLTLSACGVSL